MKVEMQTDQLEHLREKLRMAQDETRSVLAKSEVLERFVESLNLFDVWVPGTIRKHIGPGKTVAPRLIDTKIQ